MLQKALKTEDKNSVYCAEFEIKLDLVEVSA